MYQLIMDNGLYIFLVIICLGLFWLFYQLGKEKAHNEIAEEQKQEEMIKLWNEILRKHIGGRNE
jgi:hypothetical protein